MSCHMINLKGQRFTRLVVLRLSSKNKNGNTKWLCVCDCGNEVIVSRGELRGSGTRSCGCLQIKHGHNTTKGSSPTYNTWHCMKQRCLNSNNTNFPFYGGRGIKICKEWQSFEGFLASMGIRPEDKTLDRIDVNGNYEPSNCRWATWSEQTSNRSPYTRRWWKRPKNFKERVQNGK